MPQRHKGEYDECIPPLCGAATEWDVKVPDEPDIKGTVPGAPKWNRGVVVGHAANHIFNGVDIVEEGEEAEEAPDE